MSTKLDSTATMFLVVFGFMLLASFFKNVRLLALSGLALILALLLLKVVYLELTVIIAILILLAFAVVGDEIFIKMGDVGSAISLPGGLSEADKQKIKQAYAEQFAPPGCFIVVNHYQVNQWLDMIEPEFRDKFSILPDKDYQIWIYGANTITDYYKGNEKPKIEQQIKDVIQNHKIWVKVKHPELGIVWVHVKAVLKQMSWWFDPDRECVYCSGEKKTCHPEIDWLEVLT